ncbi:MAG: pyruvate ferredoxin oxidoreductase [Anaerolineae bacterium]|nr:pyruvate ferredoxin oxidoreductase [Anaerolineae bacterium]
MSDFRALDGNQAVAEAMRQINPDVVAAYPITPQTEAVQVFSQFVADGEVDTEFVTVESEHSAMSACVGAGAAGARVMTCTSSAGLALMWEITYIAASMRLPMVMMVANRALSGPINIHCDHADSMGTRDNGWIQIYSENPQEAYDNMIQAVRIAEHADVTLPVMVMQDGFITSHSVERVEVFDDAAVSGFVGPYAANFQLLGASRPLTFGALDFYDYYFEHKRQQVEAFSHATEAVLEVAADFNCRFGRDYGLFQAYRLDDAEVAVVVLSSTAGTAKVVVDDLRAQGIRAGLLKPRVFRPFPAAEIVRALSHVKAIAVMDRSTSFGSMMGAGPLFLETAAAFHVLGRAPQIPMVGYVFGLGGRDISPPDLEGVYHDLLAVADSGDVGDPVRYLGVRG